MAENRAKHYADRDPDTTYESEFEYTMGDNYELIDWYRSNMNPDEIPIDLITLVPAPAMSMHELMASSADDLPETGIEVIE